MNNDWYEKGELPPVGTVCELIWCGVPQGDVEIIAYRNNDSRVIFWHFGRGNVLAAGITTVEFLPIRTETDKLNKWAEAMIEAGYRKVKPMSEDKFVQDALEYFDFEVSQFTLICEALRKLYSAGCRFIDQGE